MLEIIILGFLSYTPLSGYDLKQTIDNSTKYFWDAKQSQIYRTLKHLEMEGKLTSSILPQNDRPDKRIYQITEKGRAMLQEWMDTPLLDVTYKKDPLLMKVFFSCLGDKQRILMQLRLQQELMQKDHQHLSQHIKGHIAEQKQTAAENPFLQNTFLIWDQTRLYGERYFQMYLDWLDETIRLIESEMIEIEGKKS